MNKIVETVEHYKYQVDIYEGIENAIGDIVPDKNNIVCWLGELKEEVTKQGIKYQDNRKTLFDLCTVVGDFLNLKKYSNSDYFTLETLEHPFYLNYKENEIPPQLKNGYRKTHNSLEKLLTLQKGFNGINLIEFEHIVRALTNTFSYKVLYMSKDKVGKEKIIKNGIEIEIEYPEYIRPKKIEDMIFDIKNISCQYEYECRSMIDIILAVLHYYKARGYKLIKCQHCGKYFAAKSKEYEYCNRLSPLIGYKNKTCGQARKAIWDKLQKRKNKLKSRFFNHPLKFDEFVEKTWIFEDKIRNFPTPENLKEYSNYLYIECENIYKKYERVR